MARMTEVEIATLLAEEEYSAKIGLQSADNWVKSLMLTYDLAELTLLLEAVTEPDPKIASVLRTKAIRSSRSRF